MSDGVSDPCRRDVLVLLRHRGYGLGKLLVSKMIDEGPGAQFRWFLVTSDAHGLYTQFGFAMPDQRFMVRSSSFPG